MGTGARRKAELRAQRRSQAVGAGGFLLAAALPVVLWHETMAMVASSWEPDPRYLAGWAPWVLMAVGLLCAVTAAVVDLRARRSRFHRAGGGAWMGWAVSLYVLGFALASQVAQIAGTGSST